MGIITKKIGNKSYAYLSRREGNKVIQKYLGPTDNTDVKKMIFARSEAGSIPERFRMLFWDTRLEKIHLKKNARYIIERILELGNLDAIYWLQMAYSAQNIIETLNTSRAVSKRSRIFWKLWFGVEDA
jgi:hypothetical protein